ncbi:hypothetical protein C8Q79DRAFT_294062 [Trametes meyenii]|nr:hypothetical protein C8Q79DRAFT_294062 [Trametes meyenii]
MGQPIHACTVCSLGLTVLHPVTTLHHALRHSDQTIAVITRLSKPHTFLQLPKTETAIPPYDVRIMGQTEPSRTSEYFFRLARHSVLTGIGVGRSCSEARTFSNPCSEEGIRDFEWHSNSDALREAEPSVHSASSIYSHFFFKCVNVIHMLGWGLHSPTLLSLLWS